ncbi:hypothetical protein MW887_001087 [Aspergillus wentii]|nr:hypothetical protein MW887_001087 [Aspergillus wentii]
MKQIAGLLVVGSLAVLLANYTTAQPPWRADIRTEWLCWGALTVALWMYQAYKNKSSEKKLGPVENPLSSPDWMTWAASLSVALFRIIPHYGNVEIGLPLTTVALFLLSHPDSPLKKLLPIQDASEMLPTAKEPGCSGRPRWVLTLAVIALGGWCSYLLLPRSQSSTIGLELFAFVIARTAAFILLDTCRKRGVVATDNTKSLSQTAFPIAIRVFGIITAAVILFPPRSDLGWPVFLNALCNMVGQGATFYLVLLGGVTSASTIDTYSTTAVQILIAKDYPRAFSLACASIISVAQGIISLPSSATGRRLLFALVLIPVLLVANKSGTRDITLSPTERRWSQSIHPIELLAQEAENKFETMLNRQSQTLGDAIHEYQRRYGRQPPPHFDKWFEAARKSDFKLIDEFDVMMDCLRPLWGVPAADIRGRVENGLNAGNGEMIRFEVAKNRVSYSMESAASWMAHQVNAWFDSDMLATLPDMVFAVNTKDEPKVIVPHDVLGNLVASSHKVPGRSKNPTEAQRVDFIEIGQQPSWDAMAVSCPTDSPARDFSQTPFVSPEISELGFISNASLSKDVCQFTDLHGLHAALLSPASLSVTHRMFPVFSQATTSVFQDLLYPSPWYAAKIDMGEYQESDDVDWDEKESVVYWAGSTTGGYSRTGNWRSMQRQRLALVANDKDLPVKLMKKTQPGSTWEVVNSTMSAISSAHRIHISAVIQCEQDACDEQETAFKLEENARDELGASYHTRYNLDVDGNGFSGRFYRLLRSKSAVIKQTLYREWHDDWLIPWFHYFPLSMDLNDLPEIIRYLTQEPEGLALGKKVAQRSRDWSNQALRKKDMELVFWRILLEYGRILSDDRDELQCCG